MEIIVEGVNTSSAHRLMNHKGKCQHLHGHTYQYKFTFYGQKTDEDSGMLVDFADLKEIVSKVLDPLDHATILNIDDKTLIEFLRKEENRLIVLGNEPTAEEMAKYLFKAVDIQLDNVLTLEMSHIVLVQVQVWETPKFSATYGLDDQAEV